MTTRAEQHRTGETLSPAELGKKTHAIITDVVTKLQEIPEFGNALHNTFFSTNPTDTGRGIGTVKFQKGDYTYGIAYKAKRSRSVSQYSTSYISITLSITKNPAAFPNNRRDADLRTEFDEAHGKILEFIDGTARVQKNNSVYEGARALEEIPEILEDLFTPIKL